MAYFAGHDKYRVLWKRDNGPQVGDWDIDYSYYSPVDHGADDDRTYPLVVILVGALEGMFEGLEIQANEMPLWCDDKYQSRFHNGHAFLMIPRAPEEDGLYWDQSCLVESLKSAIEDFCEKHPHVDKTRIHLLGWCVGALGVMNLASSYPELFASIVLLAPSRAVTKSEAARLREMPVWIMSALYDTHSLYTAYTKPAWARLKKNALDVKKLRLTTFRRALDVFFVPQIPVSYNHNIWDFVSEDLHFRGPGYDREKIVTGAYKGVKTVDGCGTPVADPYLIAWFNQFTTDGRTPIRDPRRNIRPRERWNIFFHETIGHNARLLVFKSLGKLYRLLGWLE